MSDDITMTVSGICLGTIQPGSITFRPSALQQNDDVYTMQNYFEQKIYKGLGIPLEQLEQTVVTEIYIIYKDKQIKIL